MATATQEAEAIRAHAFFRELEALPFIDAIYLHGSRARGTAKPWSDIDLAFTCPRASAEDWAQVMHILDNADTLLKLSVIRLDAVSPEADSVKYIERCKYLLYARVSGSLHHRTTMKRRLNTWADFLNAFAREIESAQSPLRMAAAFAQAYDHAIRTLLRLLKLAGEQTYSPLSVLQACMRREWFALPREWEFAMHDRALLEREGGISLHPGMALRLASHHAALADTFRRAVEGAFASGLMEPFPVNALLPLFSEKEKERSSAPRIFVAIPAYKDSECAPTVRNLFETATQPDRVTVGICWQEDAQAVEPVFGHPGQVRVLRVEAARGRGANWARGQALSLWQDEEYILQIDSHMRFVNGWDEILLSTLANAGTDRAGVTVFPLRYLPPDDRTPMEGEVPLVVVKEVADTPQQVHLMFAMAATENLKAPPQTPFIVGCCLFGPAEMFQEVQPDPHIPFYGDELSLSARLWTHGWNIVQPVKPVLWHYWPLDYRGEVSYKRQESPQNRLSRVRLRHLLRLEESADAGALTGLERYGLGVRRSLESFWRYSGVDLRAFVSTSAAREGNWPRRAESSADAPRIFVLIASAGDAECHATLASLFESARLPERVSVGLACQEEEAIDYAPPHGALRLRRYRPATERVEGWARNEALALHRGEEYILQAHAHCRFEQGWDDSLLSMLSRCPSARPVLSIAPPDYTPGHEQEIRRETRIVRVQSVNTADDPMVHLAGRPLNFGDPRGGYTPVAFWSDGCLFAASPVFHRIRFDPHLSSRGERIAHSARLWTHGYDMFLNSAPVIYQQWVSGEKKTGYPGEVDALRSRRSLMRLRHLFGLERCADPEAGRDLGSCLMGTQRPLGEYLAFAGISLQKHFVTACAGYGYFDPAAGTPSGSGKIFVYFAAARWEDARDTVHRLMENAAAPERISIGICLLEENYLGESALYPGQVSIVHADAKANGGACWLRFLAQARWKGEEFALQIEAGTRFAAGWDALLLADLAACAEHSPKPVLTGLFAESVPFPLPESAEQGLQRMAFVSAHFLFSRAASIREVKTDPYLLPPQEDLALSIRFFTHGWDAFTGSEKALFHDRPAAVMGGDEDDEAERLRSQRSIRRFEHMAGIRPTSDPYARDDLEVFGLGVNRKLEEYLAFSGFDLRAGHNENHLEGEYHVKKSKSGKKDVASVTPHLPEAEQAGPRGGESGRPRIFVAIPAFRDPECQHTVRSLFENAMFPDRVTVGICWQFEADQDRDCFEFPYPRTSQVREKRYAASESQGAGWARAEAQKLWQGEDYILQADSHMRFAKGWDEALVRMMDVLPPFSVISAYLPPYEPPDEREDLGRQVVRICVQEIMDESHAQTVMLAPVLNQARKLYPTPFVVSSFIFARAVAFREVPMDPHIAFHGDEITYSLRLWTHGYTVYQPDRVVAWHRWAPGETTSRQNYRYANAAREQKSLRRVRHLLGLEVSEDPAVLREIDYYGHGHAREMESFWPFACVDLERRTVGAKAASGEWDLVALRKAPVGEVKRPRIFVQIAAYRDPECQHTIKEMFENAAYPDRVFAGICWQFNKKEDGRFFEVPSPRPSQMRVIEVDAAESKGVCWARSKVQKLWQGEEYTLQIDSHMRFEPGWDEMLIDMHRCCPSPKSVLTTYPAGYEPPRTIKNHLTYRLVAKQFDEHGIFTMTSRAVPQNPAPDKPVLGAFAGACMLFGPSEIIREVPYDPHLYFFGEEISLSIRLWTKGWDIYHPNRPVVYHYWERKNRRTHFQDHKWQEMNKRSFARVRHMLGTEKSQDPAVLAEIEKYGLGQQRSLKDYEAFSGVDFSRKEISQAAYDGLFPAYSHKQAAVHAQKPAAAAVQAKPVARAGRPRKVLEIPEIVVYDDFLPEEDYNRLYDFFTQIDFLYINTQGKVRRVWDLTNGFPLRSERNIFYYADQEKKPEGNHVYPTRTPFDILVDHINQSVPQVSHKVGLPDANWEHFSATGWIYPPGTGLSLHDDGSGVYTGAFVYFLNPVWKPHWGGLLIVLDSEGNAAIQKQKREGNASSFHKKKWLHVSGHDELAMESGLGRCVLPKRNRMVFIHPDAFHMVTRVLPECGDNVRMSLAGFFHKAGAKAGSS